MTPVISARRLTLALVPVAFLAGLGPALVFPVLGPIAELQQVSAATVTWVLTSAFVASAVSTPIAGRLADLVGHRRVLLVAVAAVLVGSLIAATTTSFGVFIAGRVLAGAASALYPVAISAIQQHLRPHETNRAISLVSACLGIGGAAGFVVAGVLGSGDDYRVIFCVPVGVCLVTLGAVAAGMPRTSHSERGSVDVLGGLLLSVGIVLVLVPLSQASRWGLTSVRSLVCFCGGALLLAFFIRVEHRAACPMVPVRLLRQRQLVMANLISTLVGAVVFVPLVVVPILVQARPPVIEGGTAASPLVTALVYLLPGNVLAIIGTPIGSRLAQRRGPRVAFSAVGLTCLASAVLAVSLPVTPWVLVASIFLTAVALYINYGALPTQVVSLVGRSDLGITNSMISLGRWVGAALATASTSLVLDMSAGSDGPGEGDFRIAFAIGIVVSVGIVLVSVLGLRSGRRTDHLEHGASTETPIAPGLPTSEVVVAPTDRRDH